MFFFPFHSPVLKPDFYLSFGQAQGMGDFNSPPPRQVTIEVKFLLQLQNLMSCVGGSIPFWFRNQIISWKEKKIENNTKILIKTINWFILY